MNKFTMKAASRSALVVALGLGTSLGVVGAASASSHGRHDVRHDSEGHRPSHLRVEGFVTAYTGTSITVLTGHSKTPTQYTIATGATINGLKSGAVLVAGDRVNMVESSTTPGTVTMIRVQAPKVIHVEGVITDFTGNTITVLTHHSTSLTFDVTTNTATTGLAAGVSPVAGDRVNMVLSSTVSGSVVSMRVEANS